MSGIFVCALSGTQAVGQSVRFPNANPVPSNFAPATNPFPQSQPVNPSLQSQFLPQGNSQSILPNTNAAFPLESSNVLPPNGSFSTPTFDPYAPVMRPGSGSVLPPNYNNSSFGSTLGNLFGFGSSPQPAFPQPSIYPNQPGVYPSLPTSGNVPPNYASPNYSAPNFAPSIYPNQSPPALYPGGTLGQGGTWNGAGAPYNGYGYNQPNYGGSPSVFGNWFSQPAYNNNGQLGTGWFNGGPTGPIWNGQQPQVFRLFQGPRLRHTWVYGDDDPSSLEVNDTDVSLAFAIPNFFSTQPLYILPSFSIHLWDGPKNLAADLPGSAYSAFLDLGWDSDPMRTFGLETGLRLGVFSDFHTFNGDSFRILGKLIGRVRLTPTATLRAGAYYVNRNRYKVVPAGGILWVPNPDTRFDIFFPEPKLAHYLTTVGTADTWWYVTANYGGGTWTITRNNGSEDRIDINEVRLLLGLEFGKNEQIRQGRHIAFIEGGYAFNREILYKDTPADNLDVQESFVIRAGIGY